METECEGNKFFRGIKYGIIFAIPFWILIGGIIAVLVWLH